MSTFLIPLQSKKGDASRGKHFVIHEMYGLLSLVSKNNVIVTFSSFVRHAEHTSHTPVFRITVVCFKKCNQIQNPYDDFYSQACKCIWGHL